MGGRKRTTGEKWPKPPTAVLTTSARHWEYPQAYFFNGAANFNLHHYDVAEKDALAAEKLDVQHLFPQIEQLLGNACYLSATGMPTPPKSFART